MNFLSNCRRNFKVNCRTSSWTTSRSILERIKNKKNKSQRMTVANLGNYFYEFLRQIFQKCSHQAFFRNSIRKLSDSFFSEISLKKTLLRLSEIFSGNSFLSSYFCNSTTVSSRLFPKGSFGIASVVLLGHCFRSLVKISCKNNCSKF